MPLDHAEARFAQIPYAAFLGIEIAELAHEHAILRLPFNDTHMNSGGPLNGGATATLMNLAGALAAWTGIDLQAEPFLASVDLSVQYLSAAFEEDVMGSARVLRRGRDLFFLETKVHNTAEQLICQGLMIYRAPNYAGHHRRLYAQPERLPDLPVDAAPEPRLHRADFINKLQIKFLHESPGRARLSMPCVPDHTDGNGQMHEGALAALLDIAGTSASWSLVQRQGSRGATIGMQLSFLNPTREPVLADAHIQQRSEELFFSTVQIISQTTGQLVAIGNVSYRILEAR